MSLVRNGRGEELEADSPSRGGWQLGKMSRFLYKKMVLCVLRHKQPLEEVLPETLIRYQHQRRISGFFPALLGCVCSVPLGSGSRDILKAFP